MLEVCIKRFGFVPLKFCFRNVKLSLSDSSSINVWLLSVHVINTVILFWSCKLCIYNGSKGIIRISCCLSCAHVTMKYEKNIANKWKYFCMVWLICVILVLTVFALLASVLFFMCVH